jgi:hypothetical protein
MIRLFDQNGCEAKGKNILLQFICQFDPIDTELVRDTGACPFQVSAGMGAISSPQLPGFLVKIVRIRRVIFSAEFL